MHSSLPRVDFDSLGSREQLASSSEEEFQLLLREAIESLPPEMRNPIFIDLTQVPSLLARSVLNLTARLVPKRLADEEIGDLLESFAREAAVDRSSWLIRLRAIWKLGSGLFWLFVNTIRYARGSFFKKGTGGRKNNNP